MPYKNSYNKMATARKTIRRGEKQVPKSYRYKHNDDENELIVSEEDTEESCDEVDQTISVSKRRQLDDKESSSLYNLHEEGRTNCEPRNRRTEYRQKKPQLYPSLDKVESEDSRGYLQNDKHKEGFPPFMLIGIVFLIIFSLFVFANKFGSLNKDSLVKKSYEEIFEEMKTSLIELKSHTEQTKHFWIQILSQLKILVEQSPSQPAILLAIVPKNSQKTAACLSQRILEIVSSSFEDANYVSFDVQSHLEINATALKHSIDDTLKGLEKSHAAAIYNIEKLIPEAATIFHGYCDNENAPFKRALIMMTVGLDIPYSSLETGNLDSTIYQHLMALWEKGQRDVDSAAIISRISNSPIVFKPTSDEIINTLCPY